MASIRTQWQFRTYCRAGVPFLMFHKIGKCPASASMPWLYVSPIQFHVADRLGQRNEWDLGLDTTLERLMDRIQVQEWLSLVFEIGAHTLTHARLTTIPIAAAKKEIAGSKKKLEDLFGIPVKHFSYPYGDYNDAIV